MTSRLFKKINSTNVYKCNFIIFYSDLHDMPVSCLCFLMFSASFIRVTRCSAVGANGRKSHHHVYFDESLGMPGLEDSICIHMHA